MKVIDITDKLNFAEKPKIRIRDVDITINNSAVAMLRIMPKLSKKEELDMNDILESIDILVPETEMQKLEQLDLSFEDFMVFIESAIMLIRGGDDDEGEAQTRTTT